jgi:hypothetical protein
MLTAVWGILTMSLGFVRNFASFVTVRALLGVAEGGLLPGMVRVLPYIRYLNISLTMPGPLPFAFLQAQRTRPTHWNLLHRGLPFWCFRWPSRPWPQCHWTLWRSRRLAMDLHR